MKKYIFTGLLSIIALVGIYFYSYVNRDSYIYDKAIESSEFQNTGMLTENTIIRQNFIAKKNGLFKIKFKVGTYDRANDSTLKYVIKEGEEIITGGIIEASELSDRVLYEIEFDKIPNSKDKIYTLEITDNNANAENGITLYTVEPLNKEETLFINDKLVDDVMVLREVYNGFSVETFIVMIFSIAYVVLFIKILYKLFRE